MRSTAATNSRRFVDSTFPDGLTVCQGIDGYVMTSFFFFIPGGGWSFFLVTSFLTKLSFYTANRTTTFRFRLLCILNILLTCATGRGFGASCFGVDSWAKLGGRRKGEWERVTPCGELGQIVLLSGGSSRGSDKFYIL